MRTLAILSRCPHWSKPLLPHFNYFCNLQDTEEDFQSMICQWICSGLVSGLVNGLIIVTQLQWTQFVKDCTTNTITISNCQLHH